MAGVELREAWINFFLKCAHEVDSSFKRGTPNMEYVPIQTANGRRNPVSLWQTPECVKISFTIGRSSDYEARLLSSGLSCQYEEHVRHLITAVTVSPDSEVGVLLEEIAKDAFSKALPKQISMPNRSKDPAKHGKATESVR